MESATSILAENYDEIMEHLTNPIIVARLLLLEGLFSEQDLDKLEHRMCQKVVFSETLKKVIDNYEYLMIFAAVLLKHKSTVRIGKTLLRECGKLCNYWGLHINSLCICTSLGKPFQKLFCLRTSLSKPSEGQL